jgi:hypothetical protein
MRLILFFFILLSFQVFAQQKPINKPFHFKKEIKWSPLALTLGAINFQYENYYNEEKSINVWAYGLNFVYTGEFIGFGGGIGFRDYFTPEKKNSYYIEPFIKYQFMVETYTNDNFNSTGLGLVLGRKWVLGKRFTTEAFLGPVYNWGLYKRGSASTVRYPEWFGPINGMFGRFGLNVGYRFN